MADNKFSNQAFKKVLAKIERIFQEKYTQSEESHDDDELANYIYIDKVFSDDTIYDQQYYDLHYAPEAITLKTKVESDKVPSFKYTDTLTLKVGNTQYSRIDVVTSYRTIVWSYSESNMPYIKYYCSLLIYLIKALADASEENLKESDDYDFEISLVFDQTHKKSIYGKGNLWQAGYSYIAKAIKLLIPCDHAYSLLLDNFDNNFYLVNLTKDKLNNLAFDNIKYFMFTLEHGFNQPGHFEFITTANERYANYYLKDNSVNLEEALSYFDDPKKLRNRLSVLPFEKVKIHGKTWIYMDLDFGSHLYLRED